MLLNCEYKTNVGFHVAEFFVKGIKFEKTSFGQRSWPNFIQEIRMLLGIEQFIARIIKTTRGRILVSFVLSWIPATKIVPGL